MKGFIYCLYNVNDEKTVYIGSTKCEHLELRRRQHEYSFNAYLKGASSYYSAFELFLNCMSRDDIQIKLIKEVEFDETFQLKNYENECIIKYNCESYKVLNMNKALNLDKYYMNKAYRNFYKNGNKSTKIYINCPGCNSKIKVSVSPLLENHYFNDCTDYTDSE